jgi:hypothetical protein
MRKYQKYLTIEIKLSDASPAIAIYASDNSIKLVKIINDEISTTIFKYRVCF